MAQDVANHIFLPFVQPGVAANIPDTSIDKLAANQPSVIDMQVQVVVNAEPPLTKTLRLYGPGDVTGIDPHQVVRTEPKPRTTEFEPNYFAASSSIVLTFRGCSVLRKPMRRGACGHGCVSWSYANNRAWSCGHRMRSRCRR